VCNKLELSDVVNETGQIRTLTASRVVVRMTVEISTMRLNMSNVNFGTIGDIDR
jgi:hypothetical protein